MEKFIGMLEFKTVYTDDTNIKGKLYCTWKPDGLNESEIMLQKVAVKLIENHYTVVHYLVCRHKSNHPHYMRLLIGS